MLGRTGVKQCQALGDHSPAGMTGDPVEEGDLDAWQMPGDAPGAQRWHWGTAGYRSGKRVLLSDGHDAGTGRLHQTCLCVAV